MLESALQASGNLLTLKKRATSYDAIVDYITNNKDYCYRLAYYHVQDSNAAMDILQEATVNALQNADNLRNPAAVKTWFYRIVVNECMQYFRRNKRLVLTDSPQDYQTADETGTEEGRLLVKMDMEQAMNKLPPNLKTVLVLRYFEDCKIEDIAKITETNINTVKTRIRRALTQLQRLYED